MTAAEYRRKKIRRQKQRRTAKLKPIIREGVTYFRHGLFGEKRKPVHRVRLQKPNSDTRLPQQTASYKSSFGCSADPPEDETETSSSAST